MAYKHFTAMDIHNIIVRWHAGYSITRIKRALSIDRKTVRHYIHLAIGAGLTREKPLPEKNELQKLLKGFIPENKRARSARMVFEDHKNEIIALITDKTDPLKPKTAYEVICEQHGIDASYSTFKRFAREHLPRPSQKRPTTCRYETEPGKEIQIDYGKVGRLLDPLTAKNRDVFAFIATLSYSRFKYVEFVYKQDQRSFIASHLRMFEFFQGVAERIVTDNLKAAVIKPGLYDPVLNLAYQEMAEHYGCFIDPARPYHPKDKAKVERVVAPVREFFRKLKALYPDLHISKANLQARKWCRQTNGMKVHGTTGLKPLEVFQQVEKPALKPLPVDHFEIATWKEAKVHVDQFIQFEKKFYSVPYAYVAKTVWVKGSEKLIQIFYDQQLIKQYPRSSQRRQFDPHDFPKNFQLMMKEYAVQNLIERAENIGPQFKTLILNVLSPHAKLNYRRALALLNFQKKYNKELLEKVAIVAIQNKIYVPKQFERVIKKCQNKKDESIPISPETQKLLRDPEYFMQ